MRAYGLQSHIWNNTWKSGLLLAGFPILLLALIYAVWVLIIGAGGMAATPEEGLRLAAERMATTWPFALLGAGVWFAIAWAFNQKMIEAATGARGLTRKEAPDLYNMLENLSITAGRPMPKLAIIETPALNAFASGISDSSYTVTLTRGLIETLDRDELEAVMAHELTHIQNRDVRLLIIAIIFVGVFSFVGEILFRNFWRLGMRPRQPHRREDGRSQGLMILIAVAIVAIAYALAVLIRFAISRSREYLADAGAVELTKNPDAMISALQKISGHSRLKAPADVAQMFIDNDVKFMSLFATHPPIEARVEALRKFAGGR
ncbi:MAG: M48 family metallopeptidase [Pseudomonadota bacterium]